MDDDKLPAHNNAEKSNELSDNDVGTGSQSIAPKPDENIEPPTSYIKAQTDSMETHAHHLHHAPGKKIWHYFYEFLMLFLAVFAGFLAENQRENYVEVKREKEFMVSLVKDLQLDIDHFSAIRAYRIEKMRTMDSLIIFFVNHQGGQVPARSYAMALKLFGNMSFYQNSGTLDQLKGAGGFRLIRHRNVVDSILSYDQQIRRLAGRDLYETNFSVDNNSILQKLYEGQALMKIYVDSTYYNRSMPPAQTIKLNEQYLGEYLNNLRVFQSMVARDMVLQATVKDKAGWLISLIKKEYHLD